MAKKDAASKRLIRPKTTADYLARLPQFEPRPIPFADLQEYDIQVQREQGIDVQEQGKQRIDDVLSKFMARHIRDATKLKPFLKDAKRAIAAYIGARETGYDRRKARKLLLETLSDLETTKRKLQKIAQWPELSNHLKFVYRDSTPEPSSQEQVEKELQRIADLDRSYSDFAPDQIAWRLSQLETVVSLADERVSFGPGDAQRDQIAQAALIERRIAAVLAAVPRVDRAPASAGPRRLAPLRARPALGVSVGEQQSHHCDTEQNKTDRAHGSSPVRLFVRPMLLGPAGDCRTIAIFIRRCLSEAAER